MTQSLEKILDFSQQENRELELKSEHEIEEIINKIFEFFKKNLEIEIKNNLKTRPNELETIKELENNYNSLKNILTQETIEEFKKTLPPKKFLTPKTETAFNSLSEALIKAYKVAFAKISLGLLDNGLSEEDLLKANSDLKLLVEHFSLLINGKLSVNKEENPKISSDFSKLFFLNPTFQEEKIELIIKPEARNEPFFYQEQTVNLQIKKKESEQNTNELSIRLDKSQYGLGIDISSENLDKVFSKTDAIISNYLEDKESIFYPVSKIIKKNSPKTHHFNTLSLDYENKENFKDFENCFKIFAERFKKFIEIKYSLNTQFSSNKKGK